MKRTSSLNKEQVEEDLDILEMVSDLTSKLNCMHNVSTFLTIAFDVRGTIFTVNFGDGFRSHKQAQLYA